MQGFGVNVDTVSSDLGSSVDTAEEVLGVSRYCSTPSVDTVEEVLAQVLTRVRA